MFFVTITRCLVALVVGAASVLAFAPYSQVYLLVVAFAIHYALLVNTKVWQAALVGWCFGIGLFGCGSYWIYISVVNFSAFDNTASLIVTVLFILGNALFPALHGVIYSWLGCRRRNFKVTKIPFVWSLLGFATLWVMLVEIPRAFVFQDFPWLHLGYAWVDTPLAGWGRVGGVYFLSLLSLLISSTIVYFFYSLRLITIATIRYKLLVIALLWIVVWLLGSELKSQQIWHKDSGESIKVSLLQGNISQKTKWNKSYLRQHVDNYRNLIAQAWQQADLIILPEVALPVFFNSVVDSYKGWHQKLLASDKNMVVGSLVKDGKNNFNTMFVLGKSQEFPPQFYRKHILVPFGEYVPLSSWLNSIFAGIMPFASEVAGDKKQKLLKINAGKGAGKIASLICYEIAFADYTAQQASDSGVIITISNDTWFGDSLGPPQHLQMAQMRAIENARYVLRATNNGLTSIIKPNGEIVAQAEQFKRTILNGEFSMQQGTTPFQLWRSYPLIIFCLVVIMFLLNWRLQRDND